jgi:hypothetical protein
VLFEKDFRADSAVIFYSIFGHFIYNTPSFEIFQNRIGSSSIDFCTSSDGAGDTAAHFDQHQINLGFLFRETIIGKVSNKIIIHE